MPGKRSKLPNKDLEDASGVRREAERIVNEHVEKLPRLKAARDSMRRSTSGGDRDQFVQETLKKFRQRLKE